MPDPAEPGRFFPVFEAVLTKSRQSRGRGHFRQPSRGSEDSGVHQAAAETALRPSLPGNDNHPPRREINGKSTLNPN